MRLGTANIQNYPDMPQAKVAEDARTTSALCDVWGMQENDPTEDDAVVMNAVGEGWGKVHGETNLPVFYRKELYTVTGTRVHQMPLKPDLPLVAKPRLITGTKIKVRERDLPAFVVVNCHFIAGGYNGPLERGRSRQWDIEFEHLRNFVADYKRKGFTVFVLGDFNRPRPPKPVRQFTWLVGEHLDRIGVTTTGRVEVNEIRDGTVELNSDHHGQWTRVILSRTH